MILKCTILEPKIVKSKTLKRRNMRSHIRNQKGQTQGVFFLIGKSDESDQRTRILENEIEKLSNIQGACERIRNTPIPFGYAIHLKRILLIYLITLPFGFVKSLHWWSIPLMMLVFFTMIGIELIGEEIEDPFGKDVNDLPFDELQDKIEGNIDEIHGKFKA